MCAHDWLVCRDADCCRPVSRFLQHNFLQHNFCQYALEFSDSCITTFERQFFGVSNGDSRVVPHLNNSQDYACFAPQSQALPVEIEFYSATMYARLTNVDITQAICIVFCCQCCAHHLWIWTHSCIFCVEETVWLSFTNYRIASYLITCCCNCDLLRFPVMSTQHMSGTVWCWSKHYHAGRVYLMFLLIKLFFCHFWLFFVVYSRRTTVRNWSPKGIEELSLFSSLYFPFLVSLVLLEETCACRMASLQHSSTRVSVQRYNSM